MSDPFAGLDRVRWGRMRHAYGSAADVPAMLRQLADPDPATREIALDQLYASVHHQGDVYACTVAAIPFLLNLAESPGRADVVRLLASIGSAEDPDGLTGPFGKANKAVAAAFPLWKRLLTSDDPQVREAAAEVMPACADRAGEALAFLTARLAAEADTSVRITLVRTASRLARRVAHQPFLAALAALDDILAGGGDPGLRLVALTELGALGAAPAVNADDAAGLVAAVYRTGTARVQAAGFETDTLIGAIRGRHEQASEGRRAPEAAELVSAVMAAFGDRVEERARLLATMLRSPDWECRLDALYPLQQLIEGWRGDYRETAALLGDQVRDGHRLVRSRAVDVLESIGPLSAPAADALAETLAGVPTRSLPSSRAAGGDLPWVVEWPRGLPTVGTGLRVLCRIGDERALPMLGWVLDHDAMPRDAGSLLIPFGPRAVPLLPLLLRRLRDLPARDNRRSGIAYALAAMGPAAMPGLEDLLAEPAGEAVVKALAALAPEAPACLSALRQAAEGEDLVPAVIAAKALWEVEGDTEIVLAVAGRCLDTASTYTRSSGAELLGALGPAAAPYVERLRRLARQKDPHQWVPLGAGWALWRATGDATVAVPVLERAWEENVHTRPQVARYWAEMGDAAAGAGRLLRDELGRGRRHNVQENVHVTGSVDVDEELLALCRTALAARTSH